MGGQTYCASCKTMALRGRKPQLRPADVPCAESGAALRLAFISYFCFGVFLGPMAIAKALGARRLIKADPTLLGWGKATAALWLGVGGFILWILSIVGRATGN